MNHPDDLRHRRPRALRATGVGPGPIGAATGGIAGWFTLAPLAAAVTTVAATAAPARSTAWPAGRAHTRTRGA